MIGFDTVLQIAIPLIGTAGSIASILALWRELRRSPGSKITNVFIFINEKQTINLSKDITDEKIEEELEKVYNVKR